MRISDWSSDVCSSDLGRDRLDLELAGDEAVGVDIDLGEQDALVGIVGGDFFQHRAKLLARPAPFGPEIEVDDPGHRWLDDVAPKRFDGFLFLLVQAQCGHGMSPRSRSAARLMWELDARCPPREIGRAPGRERECQNVWISGG